MKVLAVIPARGGSKGIPRKNLRPLAGNPLMFYSIDACLKAGCFDSIVVTTDDDEIALFAKRFGANVIIRPNNLANDATTLDPVIQHAALQAEVQFDMKYDVVVTIQPTSPLIKPYDLKEALVHFNADEIDTVLSVVDDRHLTWGMRDEMPVPKYLERVNRQSLPLNYKETGAIIACKRNQLNTGTRIGKNVALHIMPHERSFDIDSLSDFYLCEAMISYKRIVLTAVGRKELGLGHAYRVALLAHELVKYEIIIVIEKDDLLAYDYLKNLNYNVVLVESGERLNKIIELKPDLVINDVLDTVDKYVDSLKSAGMKVVNFEDLGSGSEKADLVVNALYPHLIPSEKKLIGERYFCLRDEFLHIPDSERREDVKRVLLTFGGTDENNLSTRCLDVLFELCEKKNINIDIVVGPGFNFEPELENKLKSVANDRVKYIKGTNKISDYMISADVALTSGGRTVYELTSVGVPTIVICQNEREATHSFADSHNGIINLGLCSEIDDALILKTFDEVISDKNVRQVMRKKMEKVDLRSGKRRVIKRITALL